MPRLRFIEESEADAEARALIARTAAAQAEGERGTEGMLCAQTVGVGRLVRSLNIVSWEPACELNPAIESASRARGG